jgi:indolepyruvate ferredoxin oxidoreductase
MGDSIATNLFMLGFAWQKGCVPVSEEALLRAIELNGVAVEDNRPPSSGAAAPPTTRRRSSAWSPTPNRVLPTHVLSQSLDEAIARRVPR